MKRVHFRNALAGTMLLALCWAGAARAQQPGNAAAQQNQQKARTLLDAMVEALGGQRWLALTDFTQTGRMAGFSHGNPTGAIIDYVWYHQDPEKDRFDFGKKHGFTQIFTGREGWEVTFRGKRTLPEAQVRDFDRRRDHSIATAVRVWLKDPKTLLIYGGQNLVERHLADQVMLINEQNDAITIQTDAQTHLPLRTSWQWRDPLYHDKNTDAEEYADYHTIDGIPTPFTITRFHNGDMVSQHFLYGASYGQPPPPDFFDPDAVAARLRK